MPYTGIAAQTTAAQLALADMHARRREHYAPPWHMDRFSVPAAGTGWDTLTAHYAQALGPAWKVDPRSPEIAGPGYCARVWRDGRRAVAIALVPAHEPDGEAVLTVFRPEASES